MDKKLIIGGAVALGAILLFTRSAAPQTYSAVPGLPSLSGAAGTLTQALTQAGREGQARLAQLGGGIAQENRAYEAFLKSKGII